MDNKDIIIIVAAVAAVLVILCLIFVIVTKKKKGTEKDILLASKDLIASNAQSIEVLLVLAKGKEKTTKELKALQDKLKYLSPSTNEKVKAIDEKIKDELGDIKIELNKKKDEEKDDKVMTHFETIYLKIAERSVLTDRI